MRCATTISSRSMSARGSVRTLSQQEELPLLRDHLLRLDPTSRHDRFHGFMDDSFIERYAAKCAGDGTVIIAYIEDGVVRGAAELHPPEQSGIRYRRSPSASKQACDGGASAASCSES